MNRNNVSVIVCLMVPFLTINSCSDPFCNELIFKFENIKCAENQEKCVIDMKDVFDQSWQYLYIFHGFNTPEDISDALGFDYSGKAIYDHTRLILLVAYNEIKESFKTECSSINLDRVLNGGYVRFDSSNSQLWLTMLGNEESRKYIY